MSEVNRYNMHECDDDRYLPTLPVVLATDYDTLRAANQRMHESLSDPESVFVNMKRGTIAKPSIRSIVELYCGEVMNGEEALQAEVLSLSDANQRLEGEVKRLREAGSALSNIAYNLAQRPGVTLDVIVCDTLSSARKSWDAALSTANGEVAE